MREYVESDGGGGSFVGGLVGRGLVRSSMTASDRRLNAKPRVVRSSGGDAGGVGCCVVKRAGSEGVRVGFGGVGGGTRGRVAVLEADAESADETTVVDDVRARTSTLCEGGDEVYGRLPRALVPDWAMRTLIIQAWAWHPSYFYVIRLCPPSSLPARHPTSPRQHSPRPPAANCRRIFCLNF